MTGDQTGEGEVFTIQARRCKRCGGLLTSEKAILDGYGSRCLRKMKQEERDREIAKNQYTLFDPPEGEEAGRHE